MHRLANANSWGGVEQLRQGSAAALAGRDAIGVFPVSGWWKEKPGLQRWDRSARYALLISIRAPGAETDLYTAIANRLPVELPAA